MTEVPYGQEYLSLLSRRDRIGAYKEGRVWLTTKSAVNTTSHMMLLFSF